MHLVFWQPIPSFHQEGFLSALAQADWVDSVTLKYEFELPQSRRQSGWRDGVFEGVKLEQIQKDEIPADTTAHIHIFTGFQTHPGVWAAFHRIPKKAQCRRFTFAEAPECVGWVGFLRFMKYKMASWKIAPRLDGMLAMSQLGVDFYRSVLPQSVPVHEFAYYDVSLSDFPDLHAVDVADTDSHQSAPLKSQVSGLQSPPSSLRPPASPLRSQNYRFLCVGQLIHRKGVDCLLRALAAVTSETWTLELVGDGRQRAKLEDLSERLGIASQLKWHGSLPSAELASFYQSADCLVLPSRWDGWGMTVNEALRFGCDVLVTETCGAASAVSQSARLPKHTGLWTQFLETKIHGGALDHAARAANQQLAKSLSGEAGAARLKAILTGSNEY